MAQHNTSVSKEQDILVVDPNDDVGTALHDLVEGQTIQFEIQSERFKIQIQGSIPFGHKVAIRPIKAGQPVRKYGEVIGAATKDIEIGEHVHIHNIEGIRGRGDKAEGKEERT